jgi:enamine deaminase RidA (YjgF/YER057c/UK114 family)
MSQNMEQPIPPGKYLPPVRHADFIYTSGMTPRKARATLRQHSSTVLRNINN